MFGKSCPQKNWCLNFLKKIRDSSLYIGWVCFHYLSNVKSKNESSREVYNSLQDYDMVDMHVLWCLKYVSRIYGVLLLCLLPWTAVNNIRYLLLYRMYGQENLLNGLIILDVFPIPNHLIWWLIIRIWYHLVYNLLGNLSKLLLSFVE